jgi:RNA polymerase sigma factor (sigma-70 family)
MSALGAANSPLAAGQREAPETAIPLLLAQLRPRMLRVFTRHAIPTSDSEDLLQDALLALLVNWPTVRDPAAWLLGTVWHRCQLHARRQRRRGAEVDPEHLNLLAGEAPAHHASRDWRVDLERLSRALSPRQRRTLRLIYQHGLTEDEAADHLGISRPALHKDRWKAIVRLRQLLGRPDTRLKEAI